jgi:hypothetical protein
LLVIAHLGSRYLLMACTKLLIEYKISVFS